MNQNNRLQTLLTGALLLLVGAAFGAIVVKLAGKESSTGNPQSASPSAQSVAATQGSPQPVQDGVIVYLFHGNVRCPTCLAIEATTKEVLKTRFAETLQSGKVIVKELNYEEPANKDYIQKYQLIAPTVVMVKIEKGRETHFENLMDVWQLVGEKERFSRFIESNLQKLLDEGTT
jgi:uncharacterized protein YfkK (UPF0435 family)